MKSRLLPFVVIVLVLPVQAFAAVCFQSAANTGRTDNIKLTVEGSSEEFFSLVGEAVRVSCSATQSAPLSGSAHVRPDGTAHFGAFIAGTASCFPIIISGTLNPPAFNTGSGVIDIPSNDTFGTTTFSAISCPALPQGTEAATPDRY